MYPLRFLPFVGSSYYSNAFGKRIMVLGDSHYGAEFSPDITKDVLNRYLDVTHEREGWMNTFTKFERSLVNMATTREDSHVIWNSLLFYNYLQVLLDGPREAGTAEQYANSANAFFNVLEEYKPEVLIVWGMRLWNVLPEANWEKGEEINVEGYGVQNGYYRLSDGNKVRAFCVYHPSAGYDWGYWYKVISLFLSLNTTASMGIDAIGFENFRKFRSFPTLGLGGLNFLVGANNAGKSTFTKASLIFLDFLKRWMKGDLVIDFASDLCRGLNIANYKDALCSSAYEDAGISFSIKIGRYYYEAMFTPTEEEITGSTSRVSARYVKIVDTAENDAEYVFYYDKSINNVEAEAHLSVFSPSVEALNVFEKFISSPASSVTDKRKREKVYGLVDTIKWHIEEGDYSKSSVVKAFGRIEKIVGEEIPSNCKESLCALKEAVSQIGGGSEAINIRFTLPRNATIRDFFSKLRVINTLQQNFDESYENNVSIRSMNLCPIISLSGAKTFNVRDVDSVSKAVCTYGQIYKTLESKFTGFVSKWISDKEAGFGIGREIIVNNVEGLNEVFTLKVRKYDGEEAALTSLGTGTVHLVALLLSIVNTIVRGGSLSKQVLFLEEPEINLHPNWQSKLADFFLNVYETFGVQVIAETHSEYLIRRMQVFTAENVYKGQKTIDEMNEIFKVYYFPEEGLPYDMKFKENGHFERKFGPGFFDVAGSSFRSLMRIGMED